MTSDVRLGILEANDLKTEEQFFPIGLRFCTPCALELRYRPENLTQEAHGRYKCMVEFSF